MKVDPRKVVSGLIARGVPPHVAIGLTGNLSVESNGLTLDINEISPLVPGSRGGFGLAQWTGPRRRQFERFAGQNTADFDTQLDFLVHELNTTERRARDALYATKTADEAARVTSKRFLRPGIPHLDRRISETRRISQMMGGEQQSTPIRQPGIAAQDQPQTSTMNRLAMAQQFAPQANQLDAAAFQSRTTQNALMGFGAGRNPFAR